MEIILSLSGSLESDLLQGFRETQFFSHRLLFYLTRPDRVFRRCSFGHVYFHNLVIFMLTAVPTVQSRSRPPEMFRHFNRVLGHPLDDLRSRHHSQRVLQPRLVDNLLDALVNRFFVSCVHGGPSLIRCQQITV